MSIGKKPVGPVQLSIIKPTHHTANKGDTYEKIIILLSFAILTAALLAFAADDTKPEMRPAQKLMQARKAWLASMSENLSAKKFDAIVKDAGELVAQTQKTGENNPNPSARS